MRIDELIKTLQEIKEDRGNIRVLVNIPNCEKHLLEIKKAYEFPTCELEVVVLDIEPIKKYHSFKEVIN